MIPSDLSPVTIIEFGRPEWQAHLGGSFYGPEEHGGIPQNWMGQGRSWVVLTGLDPSRDHAVRLEAAPLAPFGSDLQEVTLMTPDGDVLLRQIFPASADTASYPLRLPRHSAPVEFRWHRFGAPVLTVSAGNQPVTRLSFDSRPELQIRDFLLRRDLLEPNTVLAFDPNFAVSPDAVLNSSEKRSLSFRLFRLTLYSLP